MTIRQKMLYSIICFVIIPMLFVPILTFKSNEKILESKINISTQQTLAEIAKNIDNVIDSMVAASNMICLDEELIDCLSKDEYESPYKWYIEKKGKIESKLTNIQNGSLYSYNTDIFIIGFDGDFYAASAYPYTKTYEDIIEGEWYDQVISMNGYMLWMAPAGEHLSLTGEDEYNITMARLIKDVAGRGKGIVLISVYPEMRLASLFKSDDKINGTQMLLINEQNNIILSNNLSFDETVINNIFSKKDLVNSRDSLVHYINDEQWVINYYTISKTNWKIVQMTPYKSLMKEIKELRWYNIAVNLLLMIILVIVSTLLSWSITNPLQKLSLLIKEIPRGDFSVQFNVKGNDEVASLGKSFNVMVQEMNALINKLEEAHRQREQARLEALQAQINPHFLLNTLNSIKWMATMSGVTNVSQMISALGSLLETSLYSSEEMIPLEQEVKYVSNYVLLQKIRYGDRFGMEIEIPDNILSYRIPCFILQPLVENAIIHGFEGIEKRGLIAIKAREEKGNIVIEVGDNGKGIPESKLNNLLKIDNEMKGRFSNIGIKNVDERIRLNYGNKYGLRITSNEGEGTLVKLILPIVEGGTSHDKGINCG